MAFPLWVAGVVLIIVGSTGNNLGNNLVSYAHEETKQKEEAKSQKSKSQKSKSDTTVSGQTSYDEENGFPEQQNEEAELIEEEDEKEKICCSWRAIGTFIFVFGNLFTFASFGFGAQSLLAALESIQFVTNLIFVKFVHKMNITNRMICATFLILAGNILVVIFAEHGAVLYTSDEMINLYQTNHIYHGYMGIAFIVWVVTTAIYMTYFKSRMENRKLLWNHTFMEPFCFAVAAALVGTQAVKFSKCMAILINVSFEGTKNEFAYYYIYLVLGVWLILVAYWLNRLDTGLKYYPPLFIIPVMQVFFVFFAIVCGGLYFKEFDHFSPTQFIGFSGGVALILSGVYGLAPTDMQLYIPPLDEEDEKLTGFAVAENGVQQEKVHPNEAEIKNIYNSGENEMNQIPTPSLQIKPQPKPQHSPMDSQKQVVMYPEVSDSGPVKNSAARNDDNSSISESNGTSSPFNQPTGETILKIENANKANKINKLKSDVKTNEKDSSLKEGPVKKNRKVVKRGTSVAPLAQLKGVKSLRKL